MSKFFEFLDYEGLPVLVDIERIAKIVPAKPNANFPNMRTIIVLFNGEEGFIAVSQTYDEVKSIFN